MSVEADSVARDARWLPHRLIDGGRGFRFIAADRQAQRSATFLDDAYLGDQLARTDIAASALSAAAIPSAAPIHFIFHSAFARSTLLARAMDIPGVAMGLKEPIILNDAADLHRRRQLAPEILDLMLRLLARPLAPGESVIIKPSNVVNPLMKRLMLATPGARVLLLYRDLPAYLRSIARKGMFGRIWARQSFLAIRTASPFDAGFSESDIFAQTDLQVAAMGWLIQHALFAHLARAMPDRVRLLDADALLKERYTTFAAVAAWFDLSIGTEAIREIVEGPAFSEDSKRIGERFSGGGKREQAPVDDAEIEMAMQWALAVAKHIGLNLDFGPRLIASR